jgi:hypothetical protein
MSAARPLVERLREAAARVGYYHESGEWVNAEWMAEAADCIDAVDGLCAYILDGQVRRLDRDVLRSLAARVRERGSQNQHLSALPTERAKE